MGNIIWELDFYSRPILDEQQKKIWEVLVCESPLDFDRQPDSLFRYSQYCGSAEVNSLWLRQAITAAIAQAGQTPHKIRFFRRQMNNMITKACNDLGIQPQPSRRTYALHQWLEERMQTIYPEQPGFDPAAIAAGIRFEPSANQPLPEALIGEKWAFVTLAAQDFEDMREWPIDFQEAFPLQIGDKKGVTAPLDPTSPIPGVVIFSNRALALAGWASGLDLAFLKVEGEPPARLLLETGASEAWILANLNQPQLQAEAQKFAQAKQKAAQVHFLAVQDHPQSESFAGFWLLQEVNLA